MGAVKGVHFRRLLRSGVFIVIAGYASSASLATAQSLYDRSQNVSVTARPHPDYDAVGYRLGSFMAYPRVSVSGTYDDNIFGLTNKTSGFIATVAPSIDFTSNWSRNSLDVNLRYERDEYLDQASESSNEFSLSSSGQVEIDHASSASFIFNAARLTESRTAPDSIAGLRQPVKYDLITTSGAIYREFNRLRLDLEVGNSFYSFFNPGLVGGGFYPEDQRDENATYERLRASWALGPNLAIFGQVTPNQNRFLKRPMSGLSSFDSSGATILGGVNLQITRLITADAGIGFFTQSYDASSISDVSGLAYNVNLRYFPTQIITVTGHADHSISASGIPGTPATDVDALSLRVDYELRRNIILSPEASFSRYNYPGISRADDRYGAGINATYLVNRSVGVTASYAYLSQSSAGGGAFGGQNFDDNRLSLTLTLQR